MVIALIIGAILLGGGGGYLLWRVNQPKTVAPTESEQVYLRCVVGVKIVIYQRLVMDSVIQ